MLAIIQARMSSKRLQGKVLKKINKKTLIRRVIEGVSKSKYLKEIIVATSMHLTDDVIYKFCKKNNINCFRGDLNNVSKRFKQLLDKTKSKNFVRICADSPFIDPKIIDKCIRTFNSNKYDIVTNVCPRSYPKGQSVEVFKSDVFKNNFSKIKSKKYNEHVTTYFYKNKKKFKIKNIFYKKNYSNINLSVNTNEDMKFVRIISKKIEKKYRSNYCLDNLISCI